MAAALAKALHLRVLFHDDDADRQAQSVVHVRRPIVHVALRPARQTRIDRCAHRRLFNSLRILCGCLGTGDPALGRAADGGRRHRRLGGDHGAPRLCRKLRGALGAAYRAWFRRGVCDPAACLVHRALAAVRRAGPRSSAVDDRNRHRHGDHADLRHLAARPDAVADDVLHLCCAAADPARIAAPAARRSCKRARHADVGARDDQARNAFQRARRAQAPGEACAHVLADDLELSRVADRAHGFGCDGRLLWAHYVRAGLPCPDTALSGNRQ